MLYIIAYWKGKSFDFMKDVCKVVYCPYGQCPNLDIKDDDWVLTMIPTSKNYKTRHKGKRLNTDKGIATSKNKPFARKILLEEGMPVPKTWFNIAEAELPYIARPKYHKQGKIFHIIKTKEQDRDFKNSGIYDKDWYYSELLDIVKEVRIILLNGKIVYSYEFPVFSSVEETLEKRATVMGTSEDPGFKAYENLTKEEEDIAVKALSLIGLKYGAIDFMYTSDGQYYISEVNYYPNLRSYVRPHFKKAIIELQKEE